MDNTPFPTYMCENHFISGHLFMNVLDQGFVYLHIMTGACEVTLDAFVESGGDAVGVMLKGTTYSSDGTSVPVFNNHEDSDREATFTVFHTPTIDVLGTEIEPEKLIFATLKNELVGSSGDATPRLLGLNENYLLRVQNISGETKNISILIGAMEV